MNKYSDAIRSSLSAIQRSKVTAVVTIEIHSRDIIERLFKENISDINAFEWLSQIRFYWEKVKYEKNIILQKTHGYIDLETKMIIIMIIIIKTSFQSFPILSKISLPIKYQLSGPVGLVS